MDATTEAVVLPEPTGAGQGGEIGGPPADRDWRAWGRVEEMEAKVAEQGRTIAEQADAMQEQGRTIALLEAKGVEQGGESRGQKEELAGLRKRAEALTRVFTWSTGRSEKRSLPYTFTDGVIGRCLSNHPGANDDHYFMGFTLDPGPTCTMHSKCSILDKNDKVLRVVSVPAAGDFIKPPVETAPAGSSRGCVFNLTAADKAGAVRADGRIKLRMVVHLYLPE